MKTKLIVEGQPLASFEFLDLPSWNKTLNQHFKTRASKAKTMRSEGHKMAYEFIAEVRKQCGETLMLETILAVVKVKTGNEKLRDIYNINIKHVFDGFVDAKLMIDDEFVHVPATLMMWAGMDNDPQYRKKGRAKRRYAVTRTIIELYELEDIIFNGVAQPLPLGREIIK